jgi:WD40 repeat protein
MMIASKAFAIQLAIETEAIYVSAFSPDRTRLLTGSAGNPIHLWNAQAGDLLRSFADHTDMVWALAWRDDRRQFVSGAFGQCVRVFQGHDGYVRCVQATRGWKRVLWGSGDHTLRLWDLEAGRCVRVLDGHRDAVYDVAFSPDERRALSTSRDIRESRRRWNWRPMAGRAGMNRNRP